MNRLERSDCWVELELPLEFVISPNVKEELLSLFVVVGVSQRLDRSDAALFELVSGVVVGCIHHARSEPPVEELDVVVVGVGVGVVVAAGSEGASHHYSEPLSFLMAYTLATQAT